MSIKRFIESDETLKNIKFSTVYEIIMVLISKGLLSMDDFKQV